MMEESTDGLNIESEPSDAKAGSKRPATSPLRNVRKVILTQPQFLVSKDGVKSASNSQIITLSPKASPAKMQVVSSGSPIKAKLPDGSVIVVPKQALGPSPKTSPTKIVIRQSGTTGNRVARTLNLSSAPGSVSSSGTRPLQYIRFVSQAGTHVKPSLTTPGVVRGTSLIQTADGKRLQYNIGSQQSVKIAIPPRNPTNSQTIRSSTPTSQRLLLPATPEVKHTFGAIQTQLITNPGSSTNTQQRHILLPSNFLTQLQSGEVREGTSLLNSQFKQKNSESVLAAAASRRLNQQSAKKPSVFEEDRPISVRPKKPCNCTKSQCLKLYCECFANGEFCSNCNCANCANNLDHEEERQRAIKQCLDRNPHAFHPKIEKGIIGDGMRRHQKGCHCKKSGCLKNYCECYEARILCSARCKCQGCKNYEDSADRMKLLPTADVTDPVRSRRDHARIAVENGAVSSGRRSHSSSKLTPGRAAHTFLTTDVAEATCSCLIAQADEAVRTRLDERRQQALVLQELGRCLQQIIDSSINSKDP